LSLDALPDPAPGQRPVEPLHLLAALAIYASPNRRLTLNEIKAAIQRRFEFFRKDSRWEGSLRHTLSLQGVFRRIEKPINVPGRGAYWVL
ncbi:winged helix DNA-binding domain-containing protein, partial [Dendrothele bispora CBS 962.96]